MRLGHMSEKGMTTLCKQGFLKNTGVSKAFLKTLESQCIKQKGLLTMSIPVYGFRLLTSQNEWKTLLEKQIRKPVKQLRTNNELEFSSSEFNNYCKRERIKKHRTIVGTPPKNGVAERMNRTLLEKARCMLSNASLRNDFGLKP
ncbi:Retrovirus-related Pol polyprotein from transposon TNT 1-94 [Gossypium australe]|uniref:Retrovirus-related Pol polyprotein from transposon TNT 1-94 n=1 Tax=Gossypium australe TaxID=47621 RepID=A0A5B6USA9_9ROSI|nr:Retrovirus-related Pol polyprotein from transposon TNT 1-94 [Gossypium australe]